MNVRPCTAVRLLHTLGYYTVIGHSMSVRPCTAVRLLHTLGY